MPHADALLVPPSLFNFVLLKLTRQNQRYLADTPHYIGFEKSMLRQEVDGGDKSFTT